MDVLDQENKNRIIEIGRIAAYLNQPESENPYIDISEQRDAWFFGWHEMSVDQP